MARPDLGPVFAQMAAGADPAAALFALPGWRREKLQALRWLGKEAAASGERLAPLLAKALVDRDWEVRATAMICAGRVGAGSVRAAVARLELPQSEHSGAVRRERGVLLALRDAVLGALGAPQTRALPQGVTEALRGDYGALPEDLAPFVFALAEPLPEPPVAPEAPGVDWTSAGPRLADGRLLSWVAPVPHWVGDGALRRVEPNPPRRVAPPQGVFIDSEPRGIAAWPDALAAAEAEAVRLGRPVRLPAADLWEMAARGPDGRRFPFGANAEPHARVDLSPWGLTGLATGPGEWLSPTEESAGPLTAGGQDSPAPAVRRRADERAWRRFRFIYPDI